MSGRRQPGAAMTAAACRMLLCLPLLAAAPAMASNLPDAVAGIGVDAHLGVTVPTGVPFVDESGRTVRLADYLGGPPVLLVPVYYTCPNLCGSALADLSFSLQRMPLRPGRDYLVVAVSIDPREGPAEAASAKARALTGDGPADLADAVHFLTGAAASTAALMRTIGFRYRWEPRLSQYVHLSGVALLSTDGRLARWLPGIGLEPADLRLAVAEAGRGGIDDLIDRFLLVCSRYDPQTGRYTSFAGTALKASSIGVVALLAGFTGLSLVREHRRRQATGREL